MAFGENACVRARRSLEAHPTQHAACQRCVPPMSTPRKLHRETALSRPQDRRAANSDPGHSFNGMRRSGSTKSRGISHK
eukprot:scaffold45436_cov72-Phaeocystis_antarctica.AAC.2